MNKYGKLAKEFRTKLKSLGIFYVEISVNQLATHYSETTAQEIGRGSKQFLICTFRSSQNKTYERSSRFHFTIKTTPECFKMDSLITLILNTPEVDINTIISLFKLIANKTFKYDKRALRDEQKMVSYVSHCLRGRLPTPFEFFEY